MIQLKLYILISSFLYILRVSFTNWTRVGDKFMVKNSDYTDFKAKYNQSRFLDDINDNKDKISEGLNTNRIKVQLLEDFIRIKYKMVD